jgi:formylmethanofuran dehydrogenase subunit B
VNRKDLAEFLGKENNLGINNIVRDHTPYKMVKSFKRGGKRYGVKRELKPNEYIITRKYD